jgi:hypothetical protein
MGIQKGGVPAGPAERRGTLIGSRTALDPTRNVQCQNVQRTKAMGVV